jgi:hypothetical protein
MSTSTAAVTHPLALGCELSTVGVQPCHNVQLVALAVQVELDEIILTYELLNVIPSLLKHLQHPQQAHQAMLM